jgi:hypothetical protein
VSLEATGQAVSPNLPVGKERRRGRRFPCEGFAEAVVIHPESLLRGEVRDISETGCFLATRAHLHVERLTEIDLRFVINEIHCHTLARVMDVRVGKGVGIEFIFPDAEAEDLFKKLVQTVSTLPPPKAM